MIMCSVLISDCVCRRPSWKPKTQPNGSSLGLRQTVTNYYRAHYHQLTIVMFKFSHYDQLTIGDRQWESIIMWYLQQNNLKLMIMCSALISDYVCRKPSWKPKTQLNGSSAVVWLSFWFSTRFTKKTLNYSNGIYLYAPTLWWCGATI